MKRGIVVKSTGSWYWVRLEEGNMVQCRIRGKFRMEGIRTTNPLAVGDEVELEEGSEGYVITARDVIILSVDRRICPKSRILLQQMSIWLCWW